MNESSSLKSLRFRNVFIVGGGLLTILLWILTDPNSGIIQDLPFGASTIVMLATLLRATWFIAMLHIGRRALLDYIDLSQLFIKAEETSEGAGKAIIGIGLMMIAVAIVICAAVFST